MFVPFKLRTADLKPAGKHKSRQQLFKLKLSATSELKLYFKRGAAIQRQLGTLLNVQFARIKYCQSVKSKTFNIQQRRKVFAICSKHFFFQFKHTYTEISLFWLTYWCCKTKNCDGKNLFLGKCTTQMARRRKNAEKV